MAPEEKRPDSSKAPEPVPDPIQAAIDYGIDIQALMDNPKRTPGRTRPPS